MINPVDATFLCFYIVLAVVVVINRPGTKKKP